MQRSSHPDDLKYAIPFISANSSQLVGVGEVGLDFTPRYIKEQCNKQEQRDVLRKQVKLCVIGVRCNNLAIDIDNLFYEFLDLIEY